MSILTSYNTQTLVTHSTNMARNLKIEKPISIRPSYLVEVVTHLGFQMQRDDILQAIES